MAKQVHSIRVVTMETGGAGPSEELRTTGQVAEYRVSDSESSDLQKAGRVALPDTTTSDTVATWWAAVVQAVKDAESIS